MSAAVLNPTQRRRNRAFFVVGGIIFCAAVALNTTVASLKVTFRKLPVQPAMPFKTLPSELGPWAQASIDEALSADLEHELGATEYVMRAYVDTRKFTANEARDFKAAKTRDDYNNLLLSVRQHAPQAILLFQMTYYTGSVDTVAHVPDRCFLADGYIAEVSQGETWKCLPVHSSEPSGMKVEQVSSENLGNFPMQFITFRNTLPGRENEVVQVAYAFNCNGGWSNDSIQGVRTPLQNPLEKFGYYSKTELRIDHPNRDDSRKAMQDFMVHAAPAMQAILPDWNKLKADSARAK